MAITYEPNTKLRIVPFDELNWDVSMDDNVAILDALAPVGSLCVTPSEVPSITLGVDVAPGKWRNNDGTIGSYAGTTGFAVTTTATTVLYLDSAGTLQSASSYPTATSIVPLATVVAGVSTITSIADDRLCFALPYIQTVGANQAAVVTTAATNSSPYGFATQAQADAIVTLVNAMRSSLVSQGLMKGSA